MKLLGGALEKAPTLIACTDEAYFNNKLVLSHQNNRK